MTTDNMGTETQEKKLEAAKPSDIIKELGLEKKAKGDLANPQAEVESKANQFVEALLRLEPSDLEAKNDGKIAVEEMAADVQRKAAHQSGMLKQPISQLSKRAQDGGEVANSLISLKMEVEALDPSKFNFEPGWLSRAIGFIPGVGAPLKRYFSKYESAQTVINAIIKSLESGRDQLIRDNITLVEDQKIMSELAQKLLKAIQLATLIDQKLQYKLDRDLQSDPERKKFVAEELLFPLRQRIMDLQQQLAVSQQGVLATEVIVRNNKELVRGVNRALNVTINALQVGATVALALANQKVVLEKVENVNKTTSDLIAGTAERLKTQGTAIHMQASQSQLSLDSLKKAFADINTAMTDISNFRVNALPAMAKSVLELDQLTTESQKAIDKMQKGNAVKPKIAIDVE